MLIDQKQVNSPPRRLSLAAAPSASVPLSRLELHTIRGPCLKRTQQRSVSRSVTRSFLVAMGKRSFHQKSNPLPSQHPGLDSHDIERQPSCRVLGLPRVARVTRPLFGQSDRRQAGLPRERAFARTAGITSNRRTARPQFRRGFGTSAAMWLVILLETRGVG